MMRIILITTLVVTSSWCIRADDVNEIPQYLKPIQKNIFERLVAPEDSDVQRDIKSLFSQYILVAAMNAANTSESNSINAPVAVAKPQQVKTEAPFHFPIQAAAPVPQPPQVIYVYVTPPTAAPTRLDSSDIKTKKPKPTKPPKTKKPKPPKVPHPDFHVESQAQLQQQQQQQQQSQSVLQQILIPQSHQPSAVDKPQQSIIAQQQPQDDIIANQSPPQSPVVAATAPPTAIPILTPSQPAAAAPLPSVTAPPVQLTPSLPTLPPVTERPRPSTDHVLNQVDKILGNVATLNITGIVDQSLQINSSKPVQNLVTGILNTIFCTPINRLLGRCRG